MSSWKDTVMRDEQIINELTENRNTIDLPKDAHPAENTVTVARNFCKAQAEISFKAGYNQSVLDNDNWARDTYGYELGKIAGIREVVEFIRFLITHLDSQYGFIKKLEASPDWQTKLKEWGVNEADKNKAHKC